MIPKEYDIRQRLRPPILFPLHHARRRPEQLPRDPRVRRHRQRDLACDRRCGGAQADGKVVLFEGDGSLLMHIQELETIKRHGLKLLMCVLNDGAYGAEIHKLRADGIDDSGAIFGRTDLAAIARGFWAARRDRNRCVPVRAAVRGLAAQDTAEIWNIHVSDRVVNASTRRTLQRGHGRM